MKKVVEDLNNEQSIYKQMKNKREKMKLMQKEHQAEYEKSLETLKDQVRNNEG